MQEIFLQILFLFKKIVMFYPEFPENVTMLEV